jgi:endonuclease-3
MQASLDFSDSRLSNWRSKLTHRLGGLVDPPRRSPIGQLIKSAISSRTRDAVSLAAFHQLLIRCPTPRDIAEAAVSEVEREIGTVTYADVKARHLVAALGMIANEQPDFDLSFLGTITVPDALAWLERHPGVGRKVAAATLNASTLKRPVFIVDSHVHRVLIRLGTIGPKASAKAASEFVTSSSGLDAEGLLELFAQMKLLGQTICRFEQAHCSLCPLATGCRTARKAMDAPRARS